MLGLGSYFAHQTLANFISNASSYLKDKKSNISKAQAMAELEKLGIPLNSASFAEQVEKGALREVELCLAAGIDPNVFRDNDTALLIATKNNNVEMVNLLLAYGANPNIKGEKGQNTPLITASERGYLDIAKALLSDKRTNPNMRDEKMLTPLMHAASKGHVEIVLALLENGANPNLANAGKTALWYAQESQNIAVVEVLRQYNAIETTLSPVNITLTTEYSPETKTIEVIGKTNLPDGSIVEILPGQYKTSIHYYEIYGDYPETSFEGNDNNENKLTVQNGEFRGEFKELKDELDYWVQVRFALYK